MFGGCDGANELNRPYDTVFLLDLKGKDWVQMETIGVRPLKRDNHAAWKAYDFMIVYGGNGAN
jgi:hypothetical protein